MAWSCLRATWWLLAAGLAALASAPVQAQALISPVVVEFGPRQKVVSVRVSLAATARPMRLQAQVLRWRQDLQGQAVTQPSDDLIVSPRIIDLRPGEQQVLRVALRGNLPAATEMTYRLLLEDVAPPASAEVASGATVNFRLAYDLPVVVPPNVPAVGDLRWRPCPPPEARPGCVRLLNAGNIRVKVQALTLAGDGWQQTLTIDEGENVLAGDEREWVIAAARGPIRGVQVRTAKGEVLQLKPAT